MNALRVLFERTGSRRLDDFTCLYTLACTSDINRPKTKFKWCAISSLNPWIVLVTSSKLERVFWRHTRAADVRIEVGHCPGGNLVTVPLGGQNKTTATTKNESVVICSPEERRSKWTEKRQSCCVAGTQKGSFNLQLMMSVCWPNLTKKRWLSHASERAFTAWINQSGLASWIPSVTRTNNATRLKTAHWELGHRPAQRMGIRVCLTLS